jgi:PleD family two-component response regulator
MSLHVLAENEFLVVCGDVRGEHEAHEIARRIEYMISRPFDLPNGVEHVVRASIGVRVSVPGDDPQRIIQDADAAMYQRKAVTRRPASAEPNTELPPPNARARPARDDGR